MKFFILFIAGCIFCLPVFSQSASADINYNDYKLLKEFLARKKNPDFNFRQPGNTIKNTSFLYIHAKNYWNTAMNDNLRERIELDMKKEFAPQLFFDSRFVSHSIPSAYGSQGYQWISRPHEKYNLGKDIAQSIIGSVFGIKNSNRNKNGYYTSTGLKY